MIILSYVKCNDYFFMLGLYIYRERINYEVTVFVHLNVLGKSEQGIHMSRH